MHRVEGNPGLTGEKLVTVPDQGDSFSDELTELPTAESPIVMETSFELKTVDLSRFNLSEALTDDLKSFSGERRRPTGLPFKNALLTRLVIGYSEELTKDFYLPIHVHRLIWMGEYSETEAARPFPPQLQALLEQAQRQLPDTATITGPILLATILSDELPRLRHQIETAFLGTDHSAFFQAIQESTMVECCVAAIQLQNPDYRPYDPEAVATLEASLIDYQQMLMTNQRRIERRIQRTRRLKRVIDEAKAQREQASSAQS